MSVGFSEGNLMKCDAPSTEGLPIFSPDEVALRENHIVGFNNLDAQARPFNILRTSVRKHLCSDKPNLIGVTSARPGDGKSFISINLAAALSRVNEATTGLLDLDLRRGRVAAEIGLDTSVGISDFLEGKVDSLTKVGWRIENTELHVYPTNAVETGSAELLAGENLQQLIKVLRSQAPGSVFIFDLPPVYANDDAMLVCQHLDSYIMVIDAGSTNRKQLEGMMRLLQPTPCLGAIMNRYKGGLLDSYGYGYGSSSSYSAYYS
jgi:Mrp family chromosome partitioning ATPase